MTSLILFLATFLLATVIAPIVIKLYRAAGWVDDPAEQQHVKRTHKEPVPRGGGIVIIVSVLIVTLLSLVLTSDLIAVLLGAILLAVTGIADDIWDIHPLFRLVLGGVAATLCVAAGITIEYVTNPFGPGVIHLTIPWLANLGAVIFIVWNMNIVNWSKGVDGQMPAFVSTAAVMIGLLSYRFIDDPAQFNTAQLAFIVAGAFAGLLLWNWYPQKIMPGYGAGSLAGYFLSILAIASGAKLATTLMVLAVPTADALFAIMRRLAAGKQPWWGDRGHMHHKLMDVLGWGRRRIAFFYWASSLSLGALSLILPTWGKIGVIAVVFALVFWFMIWAKWQTAKKI